MSRRIPQTVVLALALGLCLPAAGRAVDPEPRPPSVLTAPPSFVGDAYFTANGTVDGQGTSTTYRFEYWSDPASRLQTPEAALAPQAGPQAVSSPVTSLAWGTTYTYHLVATNASGATIGNDVQVQTVFALPNPPFTPQPQTGPPTAPPPTQEPQAALCRVPRITGMSVARAAVRLKHRGCGRLTREATSRQHRRLVVRAQHPKAGTRIRTTAPVRLTYRSRS